MLVATRDPRDDGPAQQLLAVAHVAEAGWFDVHLRRLAALPAHGNRRLTYDRLFHALLLAFFDPLARSLRAIEDRGDFGGRIDLPRLARSTTADALAALDPRHLQPILDDLRDRCPGLRHDDPDLFGITRRIVAADGTYLTTLCDVAWALRHTKADGRVQAQVRANVQLDTATWCPQVVTVSGDDGEGEPAAFARDLLPGVLYAVDRNFLDFAFVRRVLDAGSDLVLRVRANAPSTRAVASRPLTARDAEAGVVGDELVTLTGRGAPACPMRLVTIQATDRNNQQVTLRLLTTLVGDDVPAYVVGAVYRQRWQVELFFKWLKTFARLDHLLSTSRRGITFQLYMAVIAVLMMHVQAGRRVSKYALAALSHVASGQLTLGQAMAVIERRERERALNRARQARLRRRKKLA